MRKSKIPWTEKSWAIVTGCTKASAGCDNCYAENMARRLKAMGMKKYANGHLLQGQVIQNFPKGMKP
jgi:protein gp37